MNGINDQLVDRAAYTTTMQYESRTPFPLWDFVPLEQNPPKRRWDHARRSLFNSHNQ